MGSFNKKTVKDIKLTGKTVLLRSDYNVPDIGSDYRIKQSIPTIEYILKQKPKLLVIISHLGRPNGTDKDLSLQPIARRLSHLLKKRVYFALDCVGQEAKDTATRLKNGDILMLENLRFHEGEKNNSPEFAQAIVSATGAEIFIQDGFGVVHRAHASTDAITRILPSVGGLLLQKEVEVISKVMRKPEHPLIAVVGGAKVSDKLEVMNRLIELADCLAIGGAMANNFLKIRGYAIGQSLYDMDDLRLAKEISGKAEAKAKKDSFRFILPIDVVVSKSAQGKTPTRIVDLASHTISDIGSYPKIPRPASYTVGQNEAIVDIGPITAAQIAGTIGLAKTVIWNGTLGIAEVKGIAGAHAPFAHGTEVIARAMIGPHNQHPARPFSLVGGGDTSAYVESAGLIDDFDHVSTGGGASLELMAGKKLPGIEALLDKK